MRSAVIRVLSRLDLRKRDGNRLAVVRLQGAGELAHLVGAHVRIELRPDVGRNRGRIERYVMWTTADYDELDSVALFDGDVCRLEAIALCVADHVDSLGGARDWSHRNGAAGSARRGRSCATSRSSRGCRGTCIYCDVGSVTRLFLSACAGAECDRSNYNRESVEPHLLRPPRAVQQCTCQSNFKNLPRL